MKILSPHKISTEIIDVIYEAKERLVIVSPYVNFSNWDRLATELKNAKNRGVQIDFFVRNEPENAKSWEQVNGLGLRPTLVSNLHAKFYFNERNGIISSMNLLSSSNSNSIEIACKLETKDEIEELKRFVNDFIVPNQTSDIPTDDDLYLSKERFTVVLENYLSNDLRSRTSIYYKNGQFTINLLSTQFSLTIDKVGNLILITGILSNMEVEKFEAIRRNHFIPGYFDFELIRGENGYYDTLSALSKVRLSNSYLDNLRVNEKKELIAEIAQFFKCFRDFKNVCR